MGLWHTLEHGWQVIHALTIEGVPVVWTESPIGLTPPAGYTESARTLRIDDSAEVGQTIDRDTGMGAGLPLSFQLRDDATSRAWLQRWTYEARLTSNVSPTAATLPCSSTVAWPATGELNIGIERVTYTGTTEAAGVTTSFTGCTRGVAGYGYAHKAGTVGGGIITDAVRAWRGRQVRLYAVPVDPAGFVPGTTLLGQAVEVFRGHLDVGPRRDGALWAFEALALDRRLSQPLAGEVSGTVLDVKARFAIQAGATVEVHLAGYAAGVLSWGPYALIFQPFSALGDGDLLTVQEQQALISAGWDAAVTAAGAGGDLGTITWVADLYSIGYFALLELVDNAAVDSVALYVAVGGKAVKAGEVLAFPGGTGAAMSPQKALLWQAASGALLQPTVQFGTSWGLAIQLDDPLASPPSDGTGTVKIGDALALFSVAQQEGGIVYLSGLQPIAGLASNTVAYEALVGKTASIVGGYKAPFADLMRYCIESSGTVGNRGTWDVWADDGAGYAIDDDGVDEDSFAAQLGGPAVGFPGLVSPRGHSFGDLFGGLLGLAQRAVVCRLHRSSGTQRIACVCTDPTGSQYDVTITDAELLSFADEPVEAVGRLQAPNVLRVKSRVGDFIGGSQEGDAWNSYDSPGVRAQGVVEASFEIPVPPGVDVKVKLAAWGAARYLQGQTLQEVDVRLPPWLDVEVGDVVRLETTHHAIWQATTGTAGYTGQARVIGVRRNLRSCALDVTLLLDPAAVGTALCPSAEVLARDGVDAAPTALYLERRFYSHFGADPNTVPFDVIHYRPGDGTEGNDGGYTISAVEDTGTQCKLTVSAVLGGAVVSIAGLSHVTLPVTANTTAYQIRFAHADDGTYWT